MYKIRWCLDFFLVFLFIYALVFSVLPFAASKFVLLLLMGYTTLNPSIFRKIINNKLLLYCVAIWLVISIHFTLITLLYGSKSFGFLQQTFWYFFEGIFGTYVLYHYLCKRYTGRQIMSLLFTAFLFQSFFVVLGFINQPFREFTYTILKVTDERALSPYRMKGLANTGGAGLSYLQTMGVLVGSILFLQTKKGLKRMLLLVGIAFIIISQIFIARTGLIFSALLVLCLLFQQAINSGSLLTLLRQITTAFLVLSLAYSSLFLFMSKDRIDYFNDRVFARAFEFIEAYEATGELQTSSTSLLEDMYILPKQKIQFFLGAGAWDDPPGERKYSKRKVDSDVGFVRVIFALGVVFGGLFYSIYIIYLAGLWRSPFSLFFKLGILCLFLIFVLGEFKEPFLIRASGIIKVLFAVYFVFTEKPLVANLHRKI